MSSALQIHMLVGCRPTPLANYLKALGILRTIGQQVDPIARGWWKGESFVVGTSMSRNEIETFFLDKYVPTPILAPWNGGSGFYPKDKKTGIEALSGSPSPRFETYRAAILEGSKLCGLMTTSPKKEDKSELLRRCRQAWRGGAAEWFDASVVINEDGSPSYPSLLGTGGNDGRLDFTNNFMQRLTDLFDTTSPEGAHRIEAVPLLREALWGVPAAGLETVSIGQFNPGAAGGANSTNGFAGDSLVNPWDFVLMLEGSVLFRASVVRRAESSGATKAAAPFAVRGTAAGYASAASADESARGEQWMPLWDRPASLSEIRALFSEGRSQLGRRNARESVDFARALSRLGVARGISAFERYGYIERNGQANLAIPLGRWRVAPRPNQDLVDEIAPWLLHLQRIARSPHAPASFQRASRRCHDALMACMTDAGVSTRWQTLLSELGSAERLVRRNPRFAGSQGYLPLPKLGPGWIEAADDGSPEMRIATSLASLTADLGGMKSIRSYWLPIAEGRSSNRFESDASGVHIGARQVCNGNDLVLDLLALLRRRCIEVGRTGDGTLGLDSSSASVADLEDLACFTEGTFDDSKCLALATPLMALDWRAAAEPISRLRSRTRIHGSGNPGVVFGILRLAVPLGPLPSSLCSEFAAHTPKLDPAVPELLAAGNLSRGFALALRRIRAAGFRPKVRLAAGNVVATRRLAAALALPVATGALTRIARLTIKPEMPLDDSQHNSPLPGEDDT